MQGETTLRELFLLVEEGERPFPGAVPISFGERIFYFSRSVEGAAGALYESLRYDLKLPGRRWLTLTFVIHTTNPGVYDMPPPSYDRGEVMALIEGILRRLVVAPLPP